MLDRVPRSHSWLAPGFWCVACLAVFLTLGPAFLRNVNPLELSDFLQEWLSARNYQAGLPVYLDQQTSFSYHLGSNGRAHLKINAHPPSSILFALPFAALPYRDAVVVWNLFSLLALLAALILIGRELSFPWQAWHVPAGLALLLIYAYFGILRTQLEQAQWNLVLLLLLTGTWVMARTDRPVLAGVLLGLATALKLFPGLLFLSFLLLRQWRTVLAGALSFAVVTGLTLLIFGGDAYRTYFVEVLPQLDRFRSSWPGISLGNFSAKLFDPARGRMLPLIHSALLARCLTVAGSLAVLGCLLRVHWKVRTSAQRDHAFCLTLVAMLLLSPLAWDHYLLLLLLPLAWFATCVVGKTLRLWSLIVLGGLLSLHPLCYWVPVLWDSQRGAFLEILSPWHTLTVLSIHTYALVGLFIWGLCAWPDITPAKKDLTWDGSPEPSGRLRRAVLHGQLACPRNAPALSSSAGVC
jgi:Glycosyltransferase family 87